MRDRSGPWMLEGLEGLAGAGGLTEGAFLLHGLHASEPVSLLDSMHLSSSAGGGSGSGVPGGAGSPGFGVMHAALDGEVLTGSLPLGLLGQPPRLRGAPSPTVRPPSRDLCQSACHPGSLRHLVVGGRMLANACGEIELRRVLKRVHFNSACM